MTRETALRVVDALRRAGHAVDLVEVPRVSPGGRAVYGVREAWRPQGAPYTTLDDLPVAWYRAVVRKD